jgi:hypothetical protein
LTHFNLHENSGKITIGTGTILYPYTARINKNPDPAPHTHRKPVLRNWSPKKISAPAPGILKLIKEKTSIIFLSFPNLPEVKVVMKKHGKV